MRETPACTAAPRPSQLVSHANCTARDERVSLFIRGARTSDERNARPRWQQIIALSFARLVPQRVGRRSANSRSQCGPSCRRGSKNRARRRSGRAPRRRRGPQTTENAPVTGVENRAHAAPGVVDSQQLRTWREQRRLGRRAAVPHRRAPHRRGAAGSSARQHAAHAAGGAACADERSARHLALRLPAGSTLQTCKHGAWRLSRAHARQLEAAVRSCRTGGAPAQRP